MSREQQAFDTAVVCLLKQAKQSLNASGDICCYRGAEGRRCAIGALITDAEYEDCAERIEGNSVKDLFDQEIATPSLQGIDQAFLTELQAVHDGYDPPHWPIQFARLAERYKLDSDVMVPLLPTFYDELA